MYNDYELLYLASENNDEAINILYEKYKGLMYNKARRYNDSYLTLHDYLNETLYAFYEAIENYRDKVLFSTYLSKCIDNKLLNYKKSLDRNKNKILNESVPLSEYIDMSLSLRSNKLNPEEIVIKDLEYNELREKILSKLTWKEELIFELTHLTPKIPQFDKSRKNIHKLKKDNLFIYTFFRQTYVFKN